MVMKVNPALVYEFHDDMKKKSENENNEFGKGSASVHERLKHQVEYAKDFLKNTEWKIRKGQKKGLFSL